LKGRRGNVLTGSEPLGVDGGAENVEELLVRTARHRIREPKTLFAEVKVPHSVRTAGQYGHIAAVAFVDLLLDLG
jgi:hypothetical protein